MLNHDLFTLNLFKNINTQYIDYSGSSEMLSLLSLLLYCRAFDRTNEEMREEPSIKG